MRSIVLAVTLSVAIAPAARGAQPLFTEDTGVLAAGQWQLEVAAEDANEKATRQRTEVFGSTLSYGATENVDFILSLPWYRDGPDGLGDVALDVKWRFYRQGALRFALKPGITLPTGNDREGRGAGRIGWGSLVIMSWIPGALGVHAHAGYLRNENKLGERESLRHLATAATYRIGAVTVVGELSRTTNQVPGERVARYSTAGAIWSLTRDFDLDIGWRQGHGGATLDEALLLGATVRW